MAEELARDLIDRIKTDYEGFDEAFEVVDFVRSVGETLTAMRERAGLSKTELAAKLGMTPGRVWQMESGTLRHAPSLKNIARWARACEARVGLVSAPETQTEAAPAWVAEDKTPAKRTGLFAQVLRRRRDLSANDLVAAAVGDVESLARLEQAAKGTLRAAGVEDVGVAAGTPHVVGDHVEVMLTLRGPEARARAVEND